MDSVSFFCLNESRRSATSSSLGYFQRYFPQQSFKANESSGNEAAQVSKSSTSRSRRETGCFTGDHPVMVNDCNSSFGLWKALNQINALSRIHHTDCCSKRICINPIGRENCDLGGMFESETGRWIDNVRVTLSVNLIVPIKITRSRDGNVA